MSKHGWVELKRWKAEMTCWVHPGETEQVPLTTLAGDEESARRLARDAGLEFKGPVEREQDET